MIFSKWLRQTSRMVLCIVHALYVIRLQRIYNFLLLHATLSTVLGNIGLYYPLLYFFGTNLLTGGPAQICCFMPISVFRGKGISDGVEKERNQLEKLILEGNPPDGLGVHVRGVPGCPRGWGLLGNVAEIQNFPTCHQDLSMEKPATRGRRVYLHNLVDL